MDTDFIEGIVVIISLITLVVYFFMAANVSTVNHRVDNILDIVHQNSRKSYKYWIEEFYKAYSFGEIENAHRALNEAVWIKIKSVQMGQANSKNRHDVYEKAKAEHAFLYHKIQKEFPAMVDDFHGIK